MKKIPSLLLLIFLFAFPISAFAESYPYGYLDSNSDYSIVSALPDIRNGYDNDVETSVTISDKSNMLELSFEDTVKIENIYINGSNLQVLFYYQGEQVKSFRSYATFNTTYTIKAYVDSIVILRYTGGKGVLKEFDFNGTPQPKPTSPGEINDLKAIADWNQVKMSWSTDNVNQEKLDKFIVYRKKSGGTESKIAVTNSNNYIDVDVVPLTEYEYRITTIGKDGLESNGVSQKVKIPKPENVGEVSDLKAVSSWDKVDLSWTLDNVKTDQLDHINIYRQKKSIFGFGTKEKITTTKGKNYTDSGVKSDSEYQYTITTTSIEGIESDGISVTTSTPEQPKVDDVKPLPPEKQPNGDYLFKWTEPTKGEVKILIGGKEFTTVPASDKQILIKKEKLKYDVFGNPDVKLVPILEDGTEGKPINPNNPGGGFGGIDDDLKDMFTPNTLLKVAFSLLALVGGILLLRMAFMVVPKLIDLIKESQKMKKGRRVDNGHNN